MGKFTQWFMSAGLRSFGYLGGALGAWWFLGWTHVAAGLTGVFLADNWVTIKKLWKENVEPLIDEVLEK